MWIITSLRSIQSFPDSLSVRGSDQIQDPRSKRLILSSPATVRDPRFSWSWNALQSQLEILDLDSSDPYHFKTSPVIHFHRNMIPVISIVQHEWLFCFIKWTWHNYSSLTHTECKTKASLDLKLHLIIRWMEGRQFIIDASHNLLLLSVLWLYMTLAATYYFHTVSAYCRTQSIIYLFHHLVWFYCQDHTTQCNLNGQLNSCIITSTMQPSAMNETKY